MYIKINTLLAICPLICACGTSADAIDSSADPGAVPAEMPSENESSAGNSGNDTAPSKDGGANDGHDADEMGGDSGVGTAGEEPSDAGEPSSDDPLGDAACVYKPVIFEVELDDGAIYCDGTLPVGFVPSWLRLRSAEGLIVMDQHGCDCSGCQQGCAESGELTPGIAMPVAAKKLSYTWSGASYRSESCTYYPAGEGQQEQGACLSGACTSAGSLSVELCAYRQSAGAGDCSLFTKICKTVAFSYSLTDSVVAKASEMLAVE